MRLINKFLEKRWKKQLTLCHEKAEHFYRLYKLKKDVLIPEPDDYPGKLWLSNYSWETLVKRESEAYREEYLYWKGKFKQIKKKLKNIA